MMNPYNVIEDNTFFDNKGLNITWTTPTGMRIITDNIYKHKIIYWKGTICIKYKNLNNFNKSGS